MLTRSQGWCRHPAARGFAWLALLIVLFCLFQLVQLAISGGEPRPLLWVFRPRLLGATAVAAGIAAWMVLAGSNRGAAQNREALARLALVAVSMVLAFFIAEASLRIVLWRATSSSRLENLDDSEGKNARPRIRSGHALARIIRRSADKRLIYELKPHLDRTFGKVRVRTNSAGMRSDLEFAEEKSPETVRVIGIGDSGMFGWGVEQGRDYIAVLGQLLSTRGDGRRYEAINLAVPGYNTQMEVDSLVVKGLRHRPDVVVVGWCENDYGLPFLIPQDVQWTRRDVSFLWLLIFERRRFSNVAFLQVHELPKADPRLVPDYFHENSGTAGVRRSLSRLRDLAVRDGFHALVFGPLGNQTVAICREIGIPYYNTLERIPAGTWPEDWVVHGIHPRAGGHQLLAERLAEEIDRLGWILPLPIRRSSSDPGTGR